MGQEIPPPPPMFPFPFSELDVDYHLVKARQPLANTDVNKTSTPPGDAHSLVGEVNMYKMTLIGEC